MKFSNQRITKNTIYIFPLTKAGLLSRELEIHEEKKKAPLLLELRDLFDRATEGLHGIPLAYESRKRPELGHVNAYIGITSNPELRFKQHENSGFDYGFILGKTSGAKASEFERAGIRFIRFLHKKKSLCIHALKNKRSGSKDLNSNTVYIYVLYKIKRNCKGHGEIPPDEIQKYAHQLEYCLEESGLKLKELSGWLENSLKLTTKKTKKLRLAYQE